MKFTTGKPPRNRSDKPKLTIKDLPPLDEMGSHCSILQTSAYVQMSKPKVYDLLKSGRLESHVIDGRRFVLTDSIKRLVQGKATKPKRAPKFVGLRYFGSAKPRAVGRRSKGRAAA